MKLDIDPACRDCLHCKVVEEEFSAPETACFMDQWIAREQTKGAGRTKTRSLRVVMSNKTEMQKQAQRCGFFERAG